VGVPILGEKMRNYFHGMSSLHYRVYNHASMLIEVIDELRDTNMAMLTTRQNEVVKNLTIMAFVTFPLSLIAGIFGMNTINMPISDHPMGFWLILGSMFTLTALVFTYFKMRRWF
jgi:magnesium transporter